MLVIYRAHRNDDLDVGSIPSVIRRPSASPPFTDAFEYLVFNELEPTARRLFGLSNGLHFRYLMLQWKGEDDLPWINASCYIEFHSVGVSHFSEIVGYMSPCVDGVGARWPFAYLDCKTLDQFCVSMQHNV